jgi:alpha-L-fucosidase 2
VQAAGLVSTLRKVFDRGHWWKSGLVGSWQGAFQANAYARFGDGNTAAAVLDAHLQRSVNPNLTAHFNNAGAEFEIDGNLGQTAAIGEMLLQSHTGEIELLPALPMAWQNGRVTGLRARGGFTVDITWKDHELTSATLGGQSGASYRVRYGGETITGRLKPSNTVKTDRRAFFP